MKAAQHRVSIDQAWAVSIGDDRHGKPLYEPNTAGYEWYEAEEAALGPNKQVHAIAKSQS